ncbi:MAG: dihydrofolate reductase family protein [Candidatus Limnocylindrales bacterium]
MPRALQRRYGGPLEVPLRPDRPAVLANFVETLDGIVALEVASPSGGGEISGFSEPDRFVMGLLRTLADVVVVGSGTVRATPRDRWIAEAVYPAGAPLFARWRSALGLSPQPATVVVSASGDLDPRHRGLSDPAVPVVLATTEAGAALARSRGFGPHVSIAALGSDTVSPDALLGFLAGRGVGVVLCEGGPHLLAQFEAAGLLDELFLTVAPQLLGRAAGSPRLGLLEGLALPPGPDRWLTLRSVRRAGDHLFLRYARGEDSGLVDQLDPDQARRR